MATQANSYRTIHTTKLIQNWNTVNVDESNSERTVHSYLWLLEIEQGSTSIVN